MGQQLFPDWMTMSESTFYPRGPASTAFDAEGVATSDRDIIKMVF